MEEEDIYLDIIQTICLTIVVVVLIISGAAISFKTPQIKCFDGVPGIDVNNNLVCLPKTQ